jgi:hypothetical protein
MLSVVRMNLDGTNLETFATGASSKCIGQHRKTLVQLECGTNDSQLVRCMCEPTAALPAFLKTTRIVKQQRRTPHVALPESEEPGMNAPAGNA